MQVQLVRIVTSVHFHHSPFSWAYFPPNHPETPLLASAAFCSTVLSNSSTFFRVAAFASFAYASASFAYASALAFARWSSACDLETCTELSQ